MRRLFLLSISMTFSFCMTWVIMPDKIDIQIIRPNPFCINVMKIIFSPCKKLQVWYINPISNSHHSPEETTRLISITYAYKAEVSLPFFFVFEILLAFPRLMPKVTTIEAFVIRRRARLGLCIWIWDLIFSHAFSLALHKAFSLLAILLNHHHMNRVHFNVVFCCLKQPMQHN